MIYVGHWLAISIDQSHTLDTFRQLLRQGRSVSIVMLSPDLSQDRLAAYANFFGSDPAALKQKIQTGWSTVIAWANDLGSDEIKNLTIKSHSEFISHSAFGFDLNLKNAKILIDQKIWGLDRRSSFGFEVIANTKIDTPEMTLLFRYSESINKLANRGQPYAFK